MVVELAFRSVSKNSEPHTILKSIIVDHFSKRQLPQVYEVKDSLGLIEAEIELSFIIPYALHWLYTIALAVDDRATPEIHQFNALQMALRCLDKYLIELNRQTEKMLNRAVEEPLLYALNLYSIIKKRIYLNTRRNRYLNIIAPQVQMTSSL